MATQKRFWPVTCSLPRCWSGAGRRARIAVHEPAAPSKECQHRLRLTHDSPNRRAYSDPTAALAPKRPTAASSNGFAPGRSDRSSRVTTERPWETFLSKRRYTSRPSDLGSRLTVAFLAATTHFWLSQERDLCADLPVHVLSQKYNPNQAW